MHIKEIKIARVPPIDSFELKLDDRVNLFIGPNASGKSKILQAIEYVYSPSITHPMANLPLTYPQTGWKEDWDFDSVSKGLSLCWMVPSDDWPRKKPELADGSLTYREPVWSGVPLLYVPACRIGLPVRPTSWWDVEDHEHFKRLDAWERGEHIQMLLGINPEKDPVTFDSGALQETIQALWLTSALERQKRERIDHALQTGYSCARDVIKDIVTGYSIYPYIEWKDDEAVHVDELLAHPNMAVSTIDGMGGMPLYLGALSAGTQGMLLWIWAFALNMARHYRWIEGWADKPAVLLIDEIENHLHPSWQRRVIPALLRHFPKLQIFATTHSPFLVAGRKAGQVHLLRREKTGVKVTSNPKDIIGWTMDEILRTLMGIDHPTDECTARAADELRLLRKEGRRDDEGMEEARQTRMAELRRQVDRDLLAGGPMAAQREEFERLFDEALKRYPHSRNLDQDRG